MFGTSKQQQEGLCGWSEQGAQWWGQITEGSMGIRRALALKALVQTRKVSQCMF